MSNILEYTLTLQDKLSAKLRTIGVNSDAALSKFGALQQKAKSFEVETRQLGNSIFTLKNRIDLLQQERDLLPASGLTTIRAYNKEIQKLERGMNRLQTTGGMKSMFSNAFNAIPFANLLTNPLVIAGATAAASFKVGFQNDMAGVAFETLLGSQDAGKKMVDQIRTYSNVTPYQNMPLQENAKMMLAFGLTQEKIMPTLKMLGDVAMGDANKMNLLTLAFSQVSSAGKLQGQDLLQLVNAGFNPLQEISKKTGRSLANLRKDMEKGLITSDMVTEAFKSATSEGGRLYGMTQKMGESPMGKWSTFLDSLQNTLLKVYDILRPLVIPTMNLLTFIVDGLQKGIQYLIYRFQRWGELLDEGNTAMIAITGIIIGVSSVMAAQVAWTGLLALWQGILFVKTTLVTGAQWLWNIALGANPVGLIIVGIAALIALIYVIIKKYNDWGAALTLVLGPIGFLINAIMSFKRNWDSVVKAFKDDGIIGGIKRIGTVLLDAILYPVQQLLQLLSKIPGLEKLAGGGADKIQEIRNKLGLITVEKTVQDKIAPATQPGIPEPVKPPVNPNANGNKVNKGISAGGTRNTAIHINFKNMVENIVFDGNLADKRSDLENEVKSIMARVLAMAQATS